MNTNLSQKPSLVTVIGVMTLTSGIINLVWGVAASATALATIVGVICTPLTILPTILGVFEIIYAAKILSPAPQPIRPSQSIAIFEILCLLTGNVFAMVVGILALVFYNDLTVKDYFARLNGTAAPSAPAIVPQAPASMPDLETAPAPPALPLPEEPPAKPKRGRKVAGR